MTEASGHDLRLQAVGDITGKFLVPAYQRGYRWGEEQVRLLLDDIWAIEDKEDKDYCLQPDIRDIALHVENRCC